MPLARPRRHRLILGLMLLALLSSARPGLAQDGGGIEGGGRGDSVGDRSGSTADGIGRVGEGGIGIADTNVDADLVGGGVPCGSGNICDQTAAAGTGDGTGADAAGTAPPPPPPTHAEIVAALCPDTSVPTAQVGHNPREHGITGFETWIWSAGPSSHPGGSGSIRGYPVACTVTAVRFDVDTGDPHAEEWGHPRTYTTTDPGREADDTPIRHIFETAGTFPLTLTVTWQRTTSAGADQVLRTATATYPVHGIVIAPTTPPS